MKTFFHLMDNTELKAGDKLGKVTPIYDELGKNLQQFRIFHNKLSIDESMVPYYGHHSCKMFIKCKPIQFGVKIWMLCSSSGYPYAMEIHSGKKDSENQGPLGTCVVTGLLSVVRDPIQVEIYFDNFFTSYNLLKELKDMKIKATGTVREERTGHCSLTPSQTSERGTFDYRCDGDVYICRWNDNAVVTLASNHQTHLPTGTAKRYSRQNKKKIDIPEPRIVRNYNYGMGGVDILDRLLSSYRPQLRSKKWWWNLFANAVNTAVVGAWQLHRELHGKTSK
ncbi:hypothetical protein ANN_13318 [Periplaneta americana]|uniref:PiggyBac transposable element-derived protein domain-containing protein n=1 Tax=Periplaneta americana TaxID=6978 RepID=A0ABQ8TJ32_PERAM|nr:hypothetical protein ANN_13318 [Periplaneta americana]